ncbi:MAG: DMT family transporter [Clostridiales bacterium]|nr:DMT family transporter [Clostridiales bacterium]
MITGIIAGVAWALETVVLGIVFSMTPFITDTQAILLAPFVATFLHDLFSAVFMWAYNTIKGNLKNIFGVLKKPSFKWLVLASAIGGPIGMTGYVVAVNYMGASVGAVASAVYPAIGTALAYLFLKEKVEWYQWIFLILTLFGVYGLGYSPNLEMRNFWLGLLGAITCAFGWGIEAVILAKCFKDPTIKNEYALCIRQTTSAFIYGAIIIPILGGWGLTISLFSNGSESTLLIVAIAALCATLSYLFYYKTIANVGASKAMALNITYTAWAIVFTVIILRDFSVLNPITLICGAVVVVCGIFAATDFKKLFENKLNDINDN